MPSVSQDGFRKRHHARCVVLSYQSSQQTIVPIVMVLHRYSGILCRLGVG